MPDLYLVQHGEAEPESVDPARRLTARGRADVERVAAFAARLGLDVAQIRHSGKTRAEQTAALLAAALSPPGGALAMPGLAPKDDVRPVADSLGREREPLMLVGHMPFLGRLAALLICGDLNASALRFRNGGIVCLTPEQGEQNQWIVSWVLTPEMASAASR
jgi:phosphohistidine phosphatase